MPGNHQPPAQPPKAAWAPTDELFFQILGVALVIFLLKSAF